MQVRFSQLGKLFWTPQERVLFAGALRGISVPEKLALILYRYFTNQNKGV